MFYPATIVFGFHISTRTTSYLPQHQIPRHSQDFNIYSTENSVTLQWSSWPELKGLSQGRGFQTRCRTRVHFKGSRQGHKSITKRQRGFTTDPNLSLRVSRHNRFLTQPMLYLVSVYVSCSSKCIVPFEISNGISCNWKPLHFFFSEEKRYSGNSERRGIRRNWEWFQHDMWKE